MAINAVQQELARQLKAQGWSGMMVAWDENSIKIHRGSRGVIITYNRGRDTYDLTPYEDLNMGEKVEDIYADMTLEVAERMMKHGVGERIKQLPESFQLVEGPFGPCSKCGGMVSFTGTCQKCGHKAGGSIDKPEYDKEAESKPFDSGPKGKSGYDKNGLLWKRSDKLKETVDIIVNLRGKQYDAATEAFTELMQSKVNSVLTEARRKLLKESYLDVDPGGTFRDEIAICPTCHAKFPYETVHELSHMGGDECPDCGVPLKPTGKQGTFKWNDKQNIATLQEDHMPTPSNPLPVGGVKNHRYSRELGEGDGDVDGTEDLLDRQQSNAHAHEYDIGDSNRDNNDYWKRVHFPELYPKKKPVTQTEDWVNGKEDNGYICFYKGKRIEVYASSSFGAQKKAAEQLKVPEKYRYQISVTLAEKDGQPVVHTATEAYDAGQNNPDNPDDKATALKKAGKLSPSNFSCSRPFTKKPSKSARERAYNDLGMVKVKGNLGGTYYESRQLTEAKVECLECGKIFNARVSPGADPKCPNCGGYDVELKESTLAEGRWPTLTDKERKEFAAAAEPNCPKCGGDGYTEESESGWLEACSCTAGLGPQHPREYDEAFEVRGKNLHEYFGQSDDNDSDETLTEERDYTPRYTVQMFSPGYSYTEAGWETKHRYGPNKGKTAAGKPSDENLAKYIKAFEDSCKTGGVNEHLGYRKISSARIKDQQTGAFVAQYRALNEAVQTEAISQDELRAAAKRSEVSKKLIAQIIAKDKAAQAEYDRGGEPQGIGLPIKKKKLTESVANLDGFTRGYCMAALWTSDPEPGSGEYDEHDDWTVDNIDSQSLSKMKADCAKFQHNNAVMLDKAGDDDQNGHDFWLTRNGHGAGFWGRGYDKTVSDALTAAAHKFGEQDLYMGDSGKLYV